ncbi:nipped-B-like protein B [Tetranychus urticae]|uniref:RING-type E3 ubiquitin transferase BRCA1 n=1 Tax=Tetranychus urticae TaxID=32264 RepID=T1JX07_TETUR|nr:nipped-B-like protein B [Tetranychus urticae]
MNGPVTSANKLKWDPSITNPLFIEMVDLLRCHQCKKLNYSVHNLSKCAHVLCGDCKNGIAARKCPLCKIPTVEIKRDSDYESLVKDIRLLNTQYLKISFAADKNPNKAPNNDKKIMSSPRPVMKAVISPVKKVDNAAKGVESSQDLSQLTEASVFTQDLSIDEDKLDDASDTEAIGSVNKRKGREKVQEKVIPMKKQRLASDSTEKQSNDDKNKRKDKDPVKEREAEKEKERLKEKEKEKEKEREKEREKEKEKEKERLKEKEKEKLREKEKEKEKLKEKELQKKLEKEKKEAEKLEKEKAKELEKERKEKEKELAKERAKERAKEKAKERALEKAKEKARLKELEEKEKAEEEKNKNKNEDDADADAEDNDKAKSKSRKKVLAKDKVKETESDAQADNSKSSKVESSTKKRGKTVEEEVSESKDNKVSIRGRAKKKVVEEKEKEDKNKESESDDKRSTRSSPSKNLSSKNKDESPRRTGRTPKNSGKPEDDKKSSEDRIDTTNDDIEENRNKKQDLRKSVTFSPAKEFESTVSPRKSPRSNKGNMMYSRRPITYDELPLMNSKARSETKSKEAVSETETPKSTSNSKAASSKGRAKQKAKEPEASVDDEDVFVKPKATSKRAARLDSTDTSPVKRQRKAKETSDESDSPSPARSTSSRSNASKNSKSNSRILIASTLLTADQKKTLEKLQKSLGVRITADFPSNVTHLVTKSDSNKRAVRSLKYMKALLSHKWIVSFDWITESLKAGELLPEEPYELRGTTKQPENTLGAPKISRTSKKKLLIGINFYFDGKFKAADLPNLEELKDIVSTGGGTIFDNNLRLNSALRKNERVIIVKDKVKDDDKSTGSAKHIETADLLAVVTAYKTDDFFN